jgi:hypothetical protein
MTAHQQGYTGAEAVSPDEGDPSSRFVGTDSLTSIYARSTPGQSAAQILKRCIRDKRSGISEGVNIQAQDESGNWRTYNIMSSNQPQQLLFRMQQVKALLPKYRVRAIDGTGLLLALLP